MLNPFFFFCLLMASCAPFCWADSTWTCEVLPPERELITDATSGAKLVLISNSPAKDQNLYFHQRSWLMDGSMLIYRSERSGKMEYWGYIEATGELVRLEKPGITTGAEATAGQFSNALFVDHDKKLCEWAIRIEPGDGGGRSKVTVSEHEIGVLPEDCAVAVGLNENSNGTALVVGFNSNGPHKGRIISMDKATGEVQEVVAVDFGISHIQSSWNDPGLVMYCQGLRIKDRPEADGPPEVTTRMWLADLTGRSPWPLYPQLKGELVTHECFWVDHQVTFCTGQSYDGQAEEAHVKVIDYRSGVARIIGAGAWWPGGSAKDVAARNFWHSSGSPDGRFVAGDTWHGSIAIFSGKTARTRWLVQNHRTYGSGAHPHVGWDPSSTKVVFGSNIHGNWDVCIGSLPEDWLSIEW
jgi:hypothetical protein